jgi:hypothetical protein
MKLVGIRGHFKYDRIFEREHSLDPVFQLVVRNPLWPEHNFALGVDPHRYEVLFVDV